LECAGSRLESRIHVVSSPSAGKQNVAKAIKRANLEIERMMLEPLAAANSTLTDDDRNTAALW
jgi:cell division protein FtsA